MAKAKLDYKKLTMKEMMDFIKTYHNDAESKAAFAKAAVKEQKEQKTVDVLDENGNPVKYVDKSGKEKTKKQRVDKEDGKVVKVKDTFGAKAYFFKTYKEEIDFENAPKIKEADNLMDELLSW